MQNEVEDRSEKGEVEEDSSKTSEHSDSTTSKESDNKVAESSEVKAPEPPGYDWLSFGTSWSSNWLKTAKERTSTTFELVKKDLSEFGDAFASEASAIANNAVESVKHQAQNLQNFVGPVFAEDDATDEDGESEGKVKDDSVKDEGIGEKGSGKTDKKSDVESDSSEKTRGIGSGWKLPQISGLTGDSWMKTLFDAVESLAREETTADEDKITEVIMPTSGMSDKCVLSHHLLYAIQTDTETYLNPPEGDEQLYQMWLDEFDLDAHGREISNLLRNCPPMREIYQELVPKKVSNAVFWERYFYKVHQTSLIERCKNVGLDESFSAAVGKAEKTNTVAEKNQITRESTDQHSNNDETWSMCSSVEMEELPESKDDGDLTPKANESPNTKEKEADKASDSWINWEE